MAATKKPATPKTPRAPKRRAKSPRAKTAARFTTRAYALGAATLAGGALLTVFLARAFKARGAAEHVPTDLLGAKRPAPTDRAPDAFRPNPTAPVPASEREALRPATGPAPTLTDG